MLSHNFLNRHRGSRRGFTLVELAIVLGVASILFAGLWRLMASGSSQIRDQTAAEQHRQLIVATTDYLSSTVGNTFLGTIGVGNNAALAVSTVGAFASGTGFTNTTTNSYGQTFAIRVRQDTVSAYSFMVLTQNGEVIPDTSGGRISSMIGGDGGFRFGTAVCAVPPAAANAINACGSYGSWAINPLATYGQAVVGGRIASRTYVSSSASASPWLARTLLGSGGLGGTGTITDFNSIQTDISLDGNTLFGIDDGAGGIGGSIRNLNLLEVTTTSASVGLEVTTTSASVGAARLVGDQNAFGNAVVTIGRNTCDNLDTYPAESATPSCGYSLQVNGGQVVTGLLAANKMYASQFLYHTSDRRLKKEVKPIENALEKVAGLKGFSFFFKTQKYKKYGVMAQDVEMVFPELVEIGGDDYKAVDYMGLIGPIVAAISEIKEENDKLKVEIAKLKKEIEKIKEKKEPLEAKKAK